MKTIVKTLALVIVAVICLSLCGCSGDGGVGGGNADISQYLSAPTEFIAGEGVVRLKTNSISEGTIKYATFAFEAFNAVGDSLEVGSIKVTGPFENGDELEAWDRTIFLSSNGKIIKNDVAYVVVTEVELEFTDGKVVKGSYDYSSADFIE